MAIRNTCLILLISFASTSIASSDLERENLAKLLIEVDFLITRVDKIKHVPMTDQRYLFRYDYLKNDLLKIKGGINSHLKESIRLGRDLEPISGEYDHGHD